MVLWNNIKQGAGDLVHTVSHRPNLKHLFYIHSYITYIVSCSVTAELGLQHQDVVFIYGRGFRHQDRDDIKTILLSDSLMALSKVPSYGEEFLLLKKRTQIAAFDQLVKQSVEGEKFVAYLPLSKNFMMQLMATHPGCRDVAYIEEGLLTYTGNVNKPTYRYFTDSIRGKIARLLRYPNHGNRSYYYRPYSHTQPVPIYMTYAPREAVDAPVDYRVLKSLVVPPIDSKYRLNGAFLLIVDTVVEDGITSLDCFLQVLDSYITEHVSGKTDTVWIRGRPNYPVSPEIIRLFEKRSVAVAIVPEDVCAESVFYYGADLTVIGLHSSLLFYAAIWGHNSCSLLRSLFRIDLMAEQRYRRYMQIPGEFYEKVKLL